jgi:hypothetical protein
MSMNTTGELESANGRQSSAQHGRPSAQVVPTVTVGIVLVGDCPIIVSTDWPSAQIVVPKISPSA